MTERDEVVMSPRPSPRHQALASDVVFQLTRKLGVRAVQQAPVLTPEFGIRFPDGVWAPAARWAGLDLDKPLPFVPDICIEVLAAADRRFDVDQRIQAYIRGGAREVVVVGTSGELEYWTAQGQGRESCLDCSLILDQTLLRS